MVCINCLTLMSIFVSTGVLLLKDLWNPMKCDKVPDVQRANRRQTLYWEKRGQDKDYLGWVMRMFRYVREMPHQKQTQLWKVFCWALHAKYTVWLKPKLSNIRGWFAKDLQMVRSDSIPSQFIFRQISWKFYWRHFCIKRIWRWL